ncbi:MAG: SDR family oxidoreductase [Myxococcota bacterium]
MFDFNDKRILVTGGTSGIGRAAAQQLKAAGAKVLATGTNADRIEALKAEGIDAIQNDAGDPGAAEALAQEVADRLGGLDGFFANAGYGKMLPHTDVTSEAFDAQFAVNVRGPLLQTKALSGLFDDGASLVFNTSIVNVMGMPAATVYGPTKAALRNLVRVLASELSPRNIRVNAVSPGPIETDFFNRTGLPQEVQAQMAEGILARVPLKRFGKSEEVGNVALFLLSELSSFVTGAEYVVDGGMAQV